MHLSDRSVLDFPNSSQAVNSSLTINPAFCCNTIAIEDTCLGRRATFFDFLDNQQFGTELNLYGLAVRQLHSTSFFSVQSQICIGDTSSPPYPLLTHSPRIHSFIAISQLTSTLL